MALHRTYDLLKRRKRERVVAVVRQVEESSFPAGRNAQMFLEAIREQPIPDDGDFLLQVLRDSKDRL